MTYFRFALLLSLAACTSHSSLPPTPQGSAVQAAGSDELRWVDQYGDLSVGAKDGKLEGACGPLGSYDSSQAVLARTTIKLSEIARNGERYTPVGMSVSIEVGSRGDVIGHRADGSTTPLGHVAGLVNDDARDRFRAMVAAYITQGTVLQLVPTEPTESSLTLKFYNGDIDNARHTIVLAEGHEPLFDDGAAAKGVTVTYAHGQYAVTIDTPTVTFGLRSYAKSAYTVTEAADGTLALGGKAFARIPDRRACRAHDRAASELLRTFLWSNAGLRYLHSLELPEPPSPPPPPPPPPPRKKNR